MGCVLAPHRERIEARSAWRRRCLRFVNPFSPGRRAEDTQRTRRPGRVHVFPITRRSHPETPRPGRRKKRAEVMKEEPINVSIHRWPRNTHTRRQLSARQRLMPRPGLRQSRPNPPSRILPPFNVFVRPCHQTSLPTRTQAEPQPLDRIASKPPAQATTGEPQP